MSRSHRRSRIAHFKQPFVVAATSSVVALACGGQAAPDTGSIAGNGCDDPTVTCNPPWVSPDPIAECTDPLPSVGTPCDMPSHVICGDPCDPSAVSCSTGVMVAAEISCNPPVVEETPESVAVCPDDPPELGGSCQVDPDRECAYEYCGFETPQFRCEGSVWQSLPLPTCNPPFIEDPPECPTDMPAAGSDCEQNLACGYPGCEGPEASTASCVSGQWVVQYSIGPACNPPPVVPVCPSLEPQDGAHCVYDQECLYDGCTRAACDGALWSVSDAACVGRVDAEVDGGVAADAG